MVVNTWTNGSADGKASTPGNWSQGHTPASGEDIVFDGTSNTACDWDINPSSALATVSFNAGYNSTVTTTVNQGFSNSWGTVTLSSGTFASPLVNLRMVQALNLIINGGTFSPSGNTFVIVGNTLSMSSGLMTASGQLFVGAVDITGGTPAGLTFRGTSSLSSTVALPFLTTGLPTGSTLTLLTDITITVDLFHTAQGGSTICTLSVGDHTLVVGGGLTLGADTTRGGALTMSAAAVVSVVGNVGIISPGNSWIVASSGGAFSTKGTWTNLSTSPNWDFQASMTFNSTGARTMAFGAASNYVGGQEFRGAVTFDPNAAVTSFSYTMAGSNALVIGGLLTIKNTNATGTVTLDTSTSNLGITAGGVTIGARGKLTANNSIITTNGNWDSSDSSALIVMTAATAIWAGVSSTFKVRGSGGTHEFGNITVTGSYTKAPGSETLRNVSGTIGLVDGGNIVLTSGDNLGYNIEVRNGGSLTGEANLGHNDLIINDSSSNVYSGTNITYIGNVDVSGPNSTITFALTTTFSGVGKTLKTNASTSLSASTRTAVFSGSITLLSDVQANGNITISGSLISGTFFVTVTQTLTIGVSGFISSSAGGFWISSGNITNDSTSASWSFAATLRLSGSSTQTIGGTGTKNVFARVELTGAGQKDFTSDFTTADLVATVNVTMQVTAGKTWTLASGSVISADAGKVLTLRSSSSPTPWLLNAQGFEGRASNVDAKDSDASGGAQMQAIGSTDNGNNPNWVFVSSYTYIRPMADTIIASDEPHPVLMTLFNLAISFPRFKIYQLPRDHGPIVAPCILIGVQPRILVSRDYEGHFVTYPFKITILFKDGWRDPAAPAGLVKERLAAYYLQRLVNVLEAWTPDETKVSLTEKSVRRREPGLVRIGQLYLHGCGAEMDVTVRDKNPADEEKV